MKKIISRNFGLGLAASALLGSPTLWAAKTATATQSTALPSGASLDSQVDALTLPTEIFTKETLNGSPSDETLYSFQDRYSPLKGRGEIGITGGRNFSGDSFLVSQQIELNARYHISNRFAVGLAGAYAFNDYSNSAQRLYQSNGVVPDVSYAKSRADLMVHYNTFYGKMRPGFDSTVYFDQYVGLGGGIVNHNAGKANEGVVDVGFAFWLGTWGSIRLGAKDYVFKEERVGSSGLKNNVTGYVGMGVLL